jgi:hypothetical protein
MPNADYPATAELLRRHLAGEPVPTELVPILDGLADTASALLRVMGERTWPHYFSTYCIHEHHEDCRLTCKTCDAPCRCSCHRVPPAVSRDDGG